MVLDLEKEIVIVIKKKKKMCEAVARAVGIILVGKNGEALCFRWVGPTCQLDQQLCFLSVVAPPILSSQLQANVHVMSLRGILAGHSSYFHWPTPTNKISKI